jgi:hypothetical protein
MNKKKTEALTFPANPLAAMRELQDLDPSPSTEPEREVQDESEEPSPRAPHQVEQVVTATTDPVRQAILQVLSQPFQGDPLKGPFTVTTVKVPTVIWERVALFSQLTGENKQEILAKALKDFLRPGKARGGV